MGRVMRPVGAITLPAQPQLRRASETTVCISGHCGASWGIAIVDRLMIFGTRPAA